MIEFVLPGEAAEECAAFLSERTPHGWEEEEVAEGIKLRFYLEDHPFGMEIVNEIKKRWPESGCVCEERETENWALAWKDFFVPLTCGERFEILPPWLTDDNDPNLLPIIIEPKMAFGTGHHPSTALCLKCIADLSADKAIDKETLFLDLGTGSGILGIGLCKLGLRGYGLDIDPQAIVCARENAQINNVSEKLSFAVASMDGLDKEQRFGLVVANILSGPLIEMAGEIVSRLDAGASLVLSGILREQADQVASAYADQGIGRPEIRTDGEWAALLWPATG